MVHLFSKHRTAAPPESDGASADSSPARPSATPTPFRRSLLVASALALLLSAWAGIVPFVGPGFGFSADGTASWTWNLVHALGALVPGAVGLVVSIALIAGTRTRSRGGMLTALDGLVLFLCGAWFAVVPVAWPVLVGDYIRAASPLMTLAYWMGLAVGPGLLLAALGSFVMGCTRVRARS